MIHRLRGSALILGVVGVAQQAARIEGHLSEGCDALAVAGTGALDDLLTSVVTAIRRTLTPCVSRIAALWLAMHGYGCGFEVVWDDINLQDQVEEARAALYRQQAEKLRLENERE